jgi:hypothetical protein
VNTQTLTELEQHTAQLRTRIDETLAALGKQLTPAHLGRMAASKAGVKLLSGGGRVARSVKRHPRAALAVGIGLFSGWCLRRWLRR